MEPRVLMLPGFGGSADQPILVHLEDALAGYGIRSLRAELPRGRPSPGLGREVEGARALAGLRPRAEAYVGRSFGGRVLARLALQTEPRGLVLLGFPVRSAAGRHRPEDAQVLRALRCPTLLVQGSRDPLGPIRTLQRLARDNPRLELRVIPGASHAFGRAERQAIEAAVDWLSLRLG